MPGFILKNTLSDNGSVTRGICEVDLLGQLTNIDETKNICKDGEGAYKLVGEEKVALDPDSVVSMNMWAITPEFINRLDEIITFRHLDKNDFAKIADLMLGRLRDHLEEKGIKLVYNDDVLHLIAEESYSEKYGARNMRRFIRSNVEDPIAEKIIADYSRSIVGVALGYSENDDKLIIECI